MYLPLSKVIKRKIVFCCVLKVNDENNKSRIRIQTHRSATLHQTLKNQKDRYRWYCHLMLRGSLPYNIGTEYSTVLHCFGRDY
jgi:hypothetical protein